MLCRAVRREQAQSTTRVIRAALIAAAIALLGTSKLSAQEAIPSAHTVKRGDTLWDLAKLYLGDSFLWPEIYRLNTDVIDDPHWIYPGEVLKLPAAGTMPPVAETPPVKQAGEPAPTAPAPTAAPLPSASGTPVYEPPMAVLDGPNVFPKAHIDAPLVKQHSYAPPPAPAVKLGTYLSAPFVDRSGGPRGAGTIIKVVTLSVRRAARDARSLAQLHDELLIAPPAGSAAPEGQRYIAFDVGPKVEGLGQIIIPTGVVEVTRAPRDHEAAVVQVTRVFGELKAEQRLMPYDSTSLHVLGHPVAVFDSLEAQVKFIAGIPMLPTLQDFVMIDLSTHDGVRIGDEFVLFLPRHKSEGSGGFVDPEVLIARAQVVRVTPYASTLMIVGEKHPKIEEGTMARRVATMP